jgi:hypothetical protein
LPSARQTALGKDPFPDGSLPKAAGFAEGLIAFAEGRKPSAKILSAVVTYAPYLLKVIHRLLKKIHSFNPKIQGIQAIFRQ